jgi:aminoglycoside 2'-N-acetyltransferase I
MPDSGIHRFKRSRNCAPTSLTRSGRAQMELGPPGDFFNGELSKVSSRGEVRVAHTADLDAGALRAIRALLDEVFGTDLDEFDWDHALGGMHALVYERERLVAHGSVVQRQLLHRGRAHRAGYVEAVAVRPDRRRLGYGGAVMEPLERIIRAAYDLGALGATDEGAALYVPRGWRQWRGKTWALTPSGLLRTEPEDSYVYVMEVSFALDLSADLACDWRAGDVW